MGFRKDVLQQIELSPEDFVVDVGGGHRPFGEADLVIEKFPFDSDLPRNQPVVFPEVPLIIADAERLPLADQSCDFIFSSHCIEHLPDPPAFIDEVKRCSRAVYLEFPSRYLELMFTWNYHLWLIEVEGTKIVCYRNDLPQLFGDMFHREYDACIGAWGELRHKDLNTALYCKTEDLECVIAKETATEMLIRTSPKGDERVTMVPHTNRPQYLLRHIVALAAQSWLSNTAFEWIRKPRRSRSVPADLTPKVIDKLMCNNCGSTDLEEVDRSLRCACGASYERDRGVMDFDHVQVRSAACAATLPVAQSAPRKFGERLLR